MLLLTTSFETIKATLVLEGEKKNLNAKRNE